MAQSDPLSDREREVAKLLQEGKSNKLIAAALGISDRTVEFHLKNIFAKYQVSSRVELILKLGGSTGAGKGEAGEDQDQPGQSTVENMGENAENRDKPNSEKNWTTSFRETVSLIGKELKMDTILNTEDRVDPTTFFGAIRVCLTKYADFTGRASRSEFWWFTVFVTLVGAALVYLNQNLSNIFLIAMLLPLLAAGARRLHETGRSGWWQLFILAPVGGIMLLAILWAQPGKDATLPA